MPYVNVRFYKVSLMLVPLLVACILDSIAIALAYMWATRTSTYVVEEPLSITGFPSTLNTQPGENRTLHAAIHNNADVNYSVTLGFFLNDTTYQQTYVSFSNTTYTIYPGSNSITAWCATADQASPMRLSLTVEFHRE